MKTFKILLALLFVAVGFTAQAQDDAISKYFNKYLDDDRFTVVYISPKMFQLFDKMDLNLDDEEAEAIMSVVKDMRSLRILVSEETPKQFFDEAKKAFNTNSYEVLMTVRDKGGDNVEFFIKDDGGTVINELLLLVGGEDEFVLMSFVGNIDLNNISKLTEAFEGDGDDDANDD